MTIAAYVIAAMVGTEIGLCAEQKGQPNGPTPGQQAAKAPQPPVPLTGNKPPPSAIQAKGGQDATQAFCDELCIERREADAAEEQVFWAKSTFQVGVAGTILVTLTLVATGAAAYAAWRATRIAEQALIDLERPHIYVTVKPALKAWCYPGYDIATVGMRITNYGRFPAEILTCAVAANEFESSPAIGEVQEWLATVIGPGGSHPQTKYWLPQSTRIAYRESQDGDENFATPVKYAGTDLFFRIDIVYRGMGNVTYESRFIWRWDYKFQFWVQTESHRT